MVDPIRARLDFIECDLSGDHTTARPVAALRAVLDLCDEFPRLSGHGDTVRRVIAEQLGVGRTLEADVAIDWEPVSETTHNMMRAIRGDFNDGR